MSKSLSMTIAVVVLMSIITLISLYPFQFVTLWDTYLVALGIGLTAEFSDPVWNILERLFTFGPLGFVLNMKLMQKKFNRHYFLSISSIIVFAVLVECLQAGVIGRHARLLDAVFAILCGALGVTVAAIVYKNRNYLFQVSRFAIIAINVLLIWILTAAGLGAHLNNWDCEYPLVLANEATEDRPWLGKLHGVAIYTNELTMDQLRLLERTAFTPQGEILRQSMGAVAWVTADVQGSLPTLQYRNPDKSTESVSLKLLADQLDITKAITISSLEIGQKVCRDIVQHQAFTIEVMASNFDFSLRGPARIISNSINQNFRNFTVGQQNGDIVFRVRSIRNGVNGANLSVETQGNALRSGENHIVATYNHGSASIILNGKKVSIDYNKIFLFSGGVSIPVIWGLMGLLVLGGIVVTLNTYNRGALPLAQIKTNFLMVSFFPLLSYLILVMALGTGLNQVTLALIIFLPLLVSILLNVVAPYGGRDTDNLK